MSFDAEWSLDFCLSCDKQTTDGPYCSQSCRLSDIGRSCNSTASGTSSTSSSFGRGQGFFLPPAIDFSAYKRRSLSSSTASTPSSTSQSLPTSSIHPCNHPSNLSNPQQRGSIDSIDTSMSDPLISTSTPYSPFPSSTSINDVQFPEETRQALKLYESFFQNRRTPFYPHR